MVRGLQLTASSSAGNRASWKMSSASLSVSAEDCWFVSFFGMLDVALVSVILRGAICLVGESYKYYCLVAVGVGGTGPPIIGPLEESGALFLGYYQGRGIVQ